PDPADQLPGGDRDRAGRVADVDPGLVAVDRGHLGAVGARHPSEPAASVTTASIGLVELTGKSRFSASVTCRAWALAGSARASVPPQETRRNGNPSASRPSVMTTTNT